MHDKRRSIWGEEVRRPRARIDIGSTELVVALLYSKLDPDRYNMMEVAGGDQRGRTEGGGDCGTHHGDNVRKIFSHNTIAEH